MLPAENKHLVNDTTLSLRTRNMLLGLTRRQDKGLRKCRGCKLELQLSEFLVGGLWPHYAQLCLACLRCREGSKLRLADYLKARIWKLSPGACQICARKGEDGFLKLDHCHKTLRIRGFLCHRCNVGLGKAQESVAFLGELISYLSVTSHTDLVPAHTGRGNNLSVLGLSRVERSQLNTIRAKVCEVCKEDRVLVSDHCHATGRIRGFLCVRCNTTLGHFCDDKSLILAAAEYLRVTERSQNG